MNDIKMKIEAVYGVIFDFKERRQNLFLNSPQLIDIFIPLNIKGTRLTFACLL